MMNCDGDCDCTLCREICEREYSPNSIMINNNNNNNNRPERPPLPIMPKPKWPCAQKFPSKFIIQNKSIQKDDSNEIQLNRLKSGSACVINNIRELQLTKSFSCNEIREQFELRSAQSTSTTAIDHLPQNQGKIGEHKTVIYFGDSISNKRIIDKEITNDSDEKHANRLCEEMLFKRQKSIRLPASVPSTVKVDLKTVQETIESIDETIITENSSEIKCKPRITKPERKKIVRNIIHTEGYSSSIMNEIGKQEVVLCAQNKDTEEKIQCIVSEKSEENESDVRKLPSFVESVGNGVINIKIEGSYGLATKLVQSVAKDERDGISEDHYNDLVTEDINNIFHDWSFVQDWRTRIQNDSKCLELKTSAELSAQLDVERKNKRNEFNEQLDRLPFVTVSPNELIQHSMDFSSESTSMTLKNDFEMADAPLSSLISETNRSGAISLEVNNSVFLDAEHSNQSVSRFNKSSEEKVIVPLNNVSARKDIIGPTQAKNSSLIKNYRVQNSLKNSTMILRTHNHCIAKDNETTLQNIPECQSSSDENRSSGHASMSDAGHGSSSPNGREISNRNEVLVTLPEEILTTSASNRNNRSKLNAAHSNGLHRALPAKVQWNGAGFEDVKKAIQQLTMCSQLSASSYSSLSVGSKESDQANRLGRFSSMETVNTNVTSADEFVWIDSHNRLVEVQYPPWTQHCIVKLLRNGRCRDYFDRIATESIPRLGYLLQRALVRISREIQRLSVGLGLCSKHEIAGAFKIVLCPALADSSIKACLRAAAMFAVPGDRALRQTKSSRAGLHLSVGRFHRWMADAHLGLFVHEYSAVYLCAGIENLLEEIVLQYINSTNDTTEMMTIAVLESSIAANGDLWGLLQPYAHLNAGRIASGALTMPRWASQSSIGSSSGTPSRMSVEPCLLTTCVGSMSELRELIRRAQKKFNPSFVTHSALNTLFYFMRCAQLEHIENDGENHPTSIETGFIQELYYERAYAVLPPLVEWLRVASAHAEHRYSSVIDNEDIIQAGRILLPGVDCPPRPVTIDEDLPPKNNIFESKSQQSITSHSNSQAFDEKEYSRRAAVSFAFRLMLTGRSDLIIQASSLLPSSSRYNTPNHNGLTVLMIAAIRDDTSSIEMLLDCGADPNTEVPSIGINSCPAIHPETQYWTALTFAACRGNHNSVKLLLERGARVEGGASLDEEKSTLTPLQAACGSKSSETVMLLLSYGANAFLSTQQRDSLCFSGSAQRGCYSAIAVSAAHNQRINLRKILSHPLAPTNREILSLEEMLAEGTNSIHTRRRCVDTQPTLSKSQIKCLQEAMYHSVENNNLDITSELRALGIPWTLHCWTHALATAHELKQVPAIEQLLHDFLQVCPDEYNSQFLSECLPLLFSIFRCNKRESIILLLGDIFATCFGWESMKVIKEPSAQPSHVLRIDSKYVNNPELSDVTFRVEGKIFYAHKIVLVTASPRFQSMLNADFNGGKAPTVQIDEIRYHIFQLIMQFLYCGGCESLNVTSLDDLLELMAAASFFQLGSLLRFTEARCSRIIDINNVVTMYIHAKVYDAPQLLEYCQGFLLQNLVALLTYNDSVKRLLFGNKIPNHDVLNGLLQKLQSRIESRHQRQ